tara:strand:+ start:124 stop:246 length:123 start_codon:yes stop_codon:yes gene_type:complete
MVVFGVRLSNIPDWMLWMNGIALTAMGVGWLLMHSQTAPR